VGLSLAECVLADPSSSKLVLLLDCISEAKVYASWYVPGTRTLGVEGSIQL
jgi:hypothetical protein